VELLGKLEADGSYVKSFRWGRHYRVNGAEKRTKECFTLEVIPIFPWRHDDPAFKQRAQDLSLFCNIVVNQVPKKPNTLL